MKLRARLEYHVALRRILTIVLWSVGMAVPDIRRRTYSYALTFCSTCILLYQIFMTVVHIWAAYYFYCCHFLSDSAMLLRIIYAVLIELNSVVYQIIFLLKAKKLRAFLRDLDDIIVHTPTLKIYFSATVRFLFLAIFSLSCLYLSRLSSCSISRNYALAYGAKIKICYHIYFITTTPALDKLIFRWPYTKTIIQVISMWLSVCGVTFTEYWMANILRTLAASFRSSHENLIVTLNNEVLLKSKRIHRVQPMPDARSPLIPKMRKGTGFPSWRTSHFQLRLAAQHADSVLSALALTHAVATPILLCLAGFQLLQKNQEPFMNFYNSKAISYYLIVFALMRLWILCDAGEDLATQVVGLPSKLVKAQIYGIPNAVRFQVRLLASISPSVATACQFFALTRPFLLTMVGTTFTCLVVFLQVKTDPAKFAKYNNKTVSGC